MNPEILKSLGYVRKPNFSAVVYRKKADPEGVIVYEYWDWNSSLRIYFLNSEIGECIGGFLRKGVYFREEDKYHSRCLLEFIPEAQAFWGAVDIPLTFSSQLPFSAHEIASYMS